MPQRAARARALSPYERIVLVCTYGPWCRRGGDVDAIRSTLKDGVKEAGLADAVRVNQSGCLNQCGHGPMVAVWPENVWYSGVDAEGAKRIVDAHLLGGRVVEEYRYHPERPGNNKLDWIREEDRRKKAQPSG